jgi:AcrR family transcriptional regulator
MAVRKSARDRKDEIVQTALDLAFKVGPDRVTTGMIAAHIGLTQPAIYKHFPRKDDLWRSVTTTLSAQIANNISTARHRAKTPVDHLRLLVMGHLKLVHATPALPEIMVARDPKGVRKLIRMEIRSVMTGFFDELTRAVKDAQRDGSLRQDLEAQDLATLIFGVIQSLVLRMLITRDTKTLQDDAERLLNLQLSAFSPQGDGK